MTKFLPNCSKKMVLSGYTGEDSPSGNTRSSEFFLNRRVILLE